MTDEEQRRESNFKCHTFRSMWTKKKEKIQLKYFAPKTHIAKEYIYLTFEI